MSSAPFLPPIPEPPHDPTSLLLDATSGWRAAAGGLDHVEAAPSSGLLALTPMPGTGRSLTEASGSFGGLALPANVALGPDQSLYLLETETAKLKRFDPCECRFVTVPHLGGTGSGARQLRNPHGIGICAGNLFICDTGENAGQDARRGEAAEDRAAPVENHRLSVFSLHGFALRGHWRPPASAYRQAERPLRQQWQPYAVAFDGRGRVYVTDPVNRCIHRFSPAGRWEDWLPAPGPVTHLAIDCRDHLYVVVSGEERRVHVLDTEGSDLAVEDRVEKLTALFPCPPFATDAEGNLHLGPLCVQGSVAQPSSQEAPQPGPEPGVFDLRGRPLEKAPPPARPVYERAGAYMSAALDSALYRCQWHRIILHGQVPPGASVTVSTYTAEIEQPDAQIAGLAEEAWQTKQAVLQMETGRWALSPPGRYAFMPGGSASRGENGGGEWDCLVGSGGGRYLWLRLQFRGDGTVTPALDRIVIEFPRISLRRFLPAVFGQDPISADFTDRFLSLFDTTLRRIESEVDHLARYFDPLATPADRDPRTGLDFLSWLATWIGISLDRQWPEPLRRAFVKRAGRLFDRRGTREGLRQLLLLFLGMEPEQCCCLDDRPRPRCRPEPANCAPATRLPCAWEPPLLILEHYQLGRWLFVGEGRLGDQSMLWGRRIANRSQLNEGAVVDHSQLIATQDPLRDPFHVYAHQFTVFVPARCGRSDGQRRALENLLRAESPAHARYQIEYVEPRFRIGFQSTIGLDAVIARLPEGGVALGEARLGQASILTSPPHAQGGPSFQVGDSRIGSTTKLD
jgi:phage tail-like protein